MHRVYASSLIHEKSSLVIKICQYFYVLFYDIIYLISRNVQDLLNDIFFCIVAAHGHTHLTLMASPVHVSVHNIAHIPIRIHRQNLYPMLLICLPHGVIRGIIIYKREKLDKLVGLGIVAPQLPSPYKAGHPAGAVAHHLKFFKPRRDSKVNSSRIIQIFQPVK